MSELTEFEQARRRRRRKKNWRRTRRLAVLLAVVAVIGITVFAGRQLGWDSHLTNLAASLRGGKGFPVALNRQEPRQLIGVKGGVALWSEGSVTLLNSSGVITGEFPHSYNRPVSVYSGGRLLTYDVGGTDWMLTNKTKILQSGTGTGILLGGTLNDKGTMALSRRGGSGLSVVTAYNARGEEIFLLESGDCYLTVLALDDEGNYTKPYMAMVCSGGADTPLGFFATPVNYDWRLLAGPSYGQYATRIWDSYLFHTVPYYSQHKDDIEYDQFNQLGTQASLGCIRLLVCDVKWIYDNCPIGTRVVIYDNADDPGPMGKPGTIYTDPTDESKRGWDPTDPDSANPWDAAFRSGTAIRSEAAWNEWNDAQNDGRWNGSINPTDLQGWSTDSSVEGTRG